MSLNFIPPPNYYNSAHVSPFRSDEHNEGAEKERRMWESIWGGIWEVVYGRWYGMLEKVVYGRWYGMYEKVVQYMEGGREGGK